MTSPTAAAPTTTIISTSGTAHSINMPATVNSGDLLIMFVGADNGLAPTFTTPTGWSIQCALTAQGGSALSIVYVKSAAGTEGGGTVGVTTSANTDMVANVFRVLGWGGTLGTDVVSGTPATASSTAPNPPSASWSWGSLDVLAFAAFGYSKGTTVTVSADPTNYTGETNTWDSTNGAGIVTTQRALTAAASPEDPAAYTCTTTSWVANTVVVKQAVTTSVASWGQMDVGTQVQSTLLGW